MYTHFHAFLTVTACSYCEPCSFRISYLLMLCVSHRCDCLLLECVHVVESIECCVFCNKQKPGKKGQGESGWTVQAKLDVYLWLGEHNTKTFEKLYLKHLPPGFEPQYETDDPARPPISITYEGRPSHDRSELKWTEETKDRKCSYNEWSI